MDPLQALEIKAFVPARDFALAQRFYRSLGFEIPWHDEHLAYVRHGSTSFLLQHYDEPAFCASFQMHLLVSDVVLPRMSGPALAEAVQERIPAMRTLFATSRGIEEIERQGLRPEDVLRLDRTVDPRRVLQRIRESLSAKSAQ
jgi:DNA-binding NarL/FixJ family response regulator